jgi:hypothetical protein
VEESHGEALNLIIGSLLLGPPLTQREFGHPVGVDRIIIIAAFLFRFNGIYNSSDN